VAARASLGGLIASLGQSALSMSFNLCGMLAGTLLALSLGVFSQHSWALALFPGMLSLRGAIGGLFCARLSTGLHLGTVEARYRGNTRYFELLLNAVVTLTLVSGVAMGSAASLFGAFLWGVTPSGALAILTVVVAAMGLSILLVSPLTIAISVLSFKHGLDPDVIGYPVMSTMADVLVTTCYVSVLAVYSSASWGPLLLGVLDLAFLAVVLRALMRYAGEADYTGTIREFLLTLGIVSVIVNFTGAFLNQIAWIIGTRPEVYVVYPALIDTVGDIGSIVGCTATTKLFLGVLKPSLTSLRQHLTEVVGAWAASVLMFVVYSAVSSLSLGATWGDLAKLTARLLTTNLLSAPIIVAITCATAILTYKRGLNPDNFVIPIETSLADSVTTLSLLTALRTIA